MKYLMIFSASYAGMLLGNHTSPAAVESIIVTPVSLQSCKTRSHAPAARKIRSLLSWTNGTIEGY